MRKCGLDQYLLIDTKQHPPFISLYSTFKRPDFGPVGKTGLLGLILESTPNSIQTFNILYRTCGRVSIFFCFFDCAWVSFFVWSFKYGNNGVADNRNYELSSLCNIVITNFCPTGVNPKSFGCLCSFFMTFPNLNDKIITYKVVS